MTQSSRTGKPRDFEPNGSMTIGLCIPQLVDTGNCTGGTIEYSNWGNSRRCWVQSYMGTPLARLRPGNLPNDD